MIQANQLRIGNKFMGAGMIQTVKEILDYGVTGSVQANQIGKVEATPGYEHLILVHENRNQYKPVDMEGVALTPEILEKCGFKLDGFKQYGIDLPKIISLSDRRIYFAGDYLYLQEGSGRNPSLDLVTLWNKDLMKNFYLHSLQNVFYALTGEELIINP